MPESELTPTLILDFLHDRIPAEELPPPAWGPIGEDVFKRSYSRNILEADESVAKGWRWSIPANRTTECWGETVRRVVLGNLAYAGQENIDYDPFLESEAVDLFQMIYEFKIVPAGRHLWMTGVPGAALKNCHRAGWSAQTSDHFRFLGSQLFLGGGVGSNYSAKFRERGQIVSGNLDITIICTSAHPDHDAVKVSADGLWWEDRPGPFTERIRVQDTREGWVSTWTRLIDLACTPGNHDVIVDVSDVREHGAPLLTMGGRASGPSPLAASLVQILKVLKGAHGRHLSAIEAMRIDHHIAAAIVAGGTRRSARMSQLNWDDPEIFDFISHKTNDPSVSWSTNISVVIDDAFHLALANGNQTAHDVMHAIASGMASDGEPGIYNLALAQVGERRDVSATNPCGEAILEEHYDPTTGKGSASGESCNLGSVDLDAIGANYGEAKQAFHLLSRFLYRATLAPIYDKDQEEIENRNRRLGVGIMGLQGWCASYGLKLSDLPYADGLQQALTDFRIEARRGANGIAYELGLPAPIKVTAVAPTGSIALLRGTTSAINPVPAKYFVRRVQYSESDPILLDKMAQGYPVEDSVYAAHTKVVSFPVADIILDRHPEELIEQQDEISIDTFLKIQATVQATFCGGEDGQAISATASIPAGADPDQLVEVLKDNIAGLKGLTAFPSLSRPQQPITAISRVEWAELSLALLEKVSAGDSNDGACVGGACPIR